MNSIAASRLKSSRAKSAPAPDSLPADDLDIVIIRSARRKKTISAKLVNWHTLEVRAPAKISQRELDDMVTRLKERALKQRSKWRNFSSDGELDLRAHKLNRALFGGELRWRSIRFVTNQNSRFGSCTPGNGTIRLSHRLARVPTFVLDYVIVHELAHLIEANHSRAFWDLVYRYELTERARGYLMAMDLEDDGDDHG